MPDQLVALLLNEWREAERDLANLAPDASAEATMNANRRVDSLRTAYHEAARVLELLHATDRPRQPDLR